MSSDTLRQTSVLFGSRRDNLSNDSSISCHLTELEAITEHSDDSSTPRYVCHFDSENGYRDTLSVSLPDTFVKKHDASIKSGTAHYLIPSEYRSGKRLEVPEGVQLQPSARRKLISHEELLTGTRRVLAVRITTSFGEQPEESVDEISRAIFGSISDDSENSSTSVVRQYHDVSHGQLQLIPATGNGIVNGVAQVQLDVQVAGKEVQLDLTSEILAATQAALGDLDLVADNYIFCIPNSSLLSGKATWTAFTYLFEPYSYYQQSRCTKLSVVMHELGHSLSLRHSGYMGNEYADESDYMGYAVNEFNYPRKAFNAHKHWVTTWFSDMALQVYPRRAPVIANLASFVDYGNENVQPNDVVLLRAGNLYFQYNRAKGYNIETPNVFKNRVVVTESEGDLEISSFVAALSKGQSYVYPNFSDYNGLVIEVCEQMTGPYDYAIVSLYIDNGKQKSRCGASDIDTRSPDTYPFDTSDIANLPESGSLIFETPSASEHNKTNKAAVGVVWGIVGVLFVVALLLIHTMKFRKKQNLSPSSKSTANGTRSVGRFKWNLSKTQTDSSCSGDSNANVAVGSDQVEGECLPRFILITSEQEAESCLETVP